MLTCCCQHKCRLLETCGHCNKLISLFTSPFKLGYCPRCQRSLELCAATSVTDEVELEVAVQIQNDILFLLIPQPRVGENGHIIRSVGRRLAHIRRTKKLTAVEVASQIGVTLTVVEGMERGDFQGRGATLQCYFKYAHYLSLCLKEVFSDTTDVPSHIPATSLSLCPICQQSCYVTRVGYNRSGSQRYECHHCRRSFTASPKAREVKSLSS